MCVVEEQAAILTFGARYHPPPHWSFPTILRCSHTSNCWYLNIKSTHTACNKSKNSIAPCRSTTLHCCNPAAGGFIQLVNTPCIKLGLSLCWSFIASVIPRNIHPHLMCWVYSVSRRKSSSPCQASLLHCSSLPSCREHLKATCDRLRWRRSCPGHPKEWSMPIKEAILA